MSQISRNKKKKSWRAQSNNTVISVKLIDIFLFKFDNKFSELH